jgi:holo-ACP synthase CitX
MTILKRLLNGREERASLQAHILLESELAIQVSLNIPGLPKRMKGDREVVSRVMDLIREGILLIGGGAPILFFLDNGTGYAGILGAAGADPLAVKRLGMGIENQPWGSVIDVDVISRRGAIHRALLDGGERKCFICGRPAKHCTRLQRHSFPQLREACQRMLTMAQQTLRV